VRRQLRDRPDAFTTTGSKFESVVHEPRKSVKRCAVVGFLEQAGATLPRKDHRRLKLAAGALSTLRDNAAIIYTLDLVRRRYPMQFPVHTYGILRRGLVRARDRKHARAQREGVVSEAAERLAKTDSRPELDRHGYRQKHPSGSTDTRCPTA
jgi:hypothetical protein